MNKGELIYLKLSDGDHVFLNVNEIVAVLVFHIAKDNSDDDSISAETFETELNFCMSDKSHYEYVFDDNDPEGIAVLRQLKNFVSEEAFR